MYYIYILTNKSNCIYVGVTNNLMRRMYEHEKGLFVSFTSKYKINKLIYYEEYNNIGEAIKREKTIKGWVRKKKILLIKSINPFFKDLKMIPTFVGDSSLRSE